MYNLKNYGGTQRRSEILDLQNTLQQLKRTVSKILKKNSADMQKI